MKKAKVVLLVCDDYEIRPVYNTVRRGIDLLGGFSSFAKPSDRIILKPNIMAGNEPQKCVTTHPSVFWAVGKIFREAGVILSYGDSPATGEFETNAIKCGIQPVAEELQITMDNLEQGREINHKTALLYKKFVIANAILDADGIVSLPKLKTHGFMKITGAVKNQFGCIPGILKRHLHVNMSDPNDFATMLVDLTTYLRPRLYIMDAIMAMEGNGPRNGNPKKLSTILMSTDPVALDAIACRIIDLDPELVPTSGPGEKSGLGSYHYENIDLVGDPIDHLIQKDFNVTRYPVAIYSKAYLKPLLKNYITPRPSIIETRCNGCGACIKVCPVGFTAIDWNTQKIGKRPKHNYRNCIRCYCCQEICPRGAIIVKNPSWSHLFFMVYRQFLKLIGQSI
jgi:uncharacterized protein (DUF362 family)/NAD-dependent dihydropyrimidine dehydrogenase PreA subunit